MDEGTTERRQNHRRSLLPRLLLPPPPPLLLLLLLLLLMVVVRATVQACPDHRRCLRLRRDRRLSIGTGHRPWRPKTWSGRKEGTKEGTKEKNKKRRVFQVRTQTKPLTTNRGRLRRQQRDETTRCNTTQNCVGGNMFGVCCSHFRSRPTMHVPSGPRKSSKGEKNTKRDREITTECRLL